MFIKDIFTKIKNSETVRNMALSGICKPIAMLVSLIYVRVVLSFLGDEKYGVWSTLLTILSWVSYFDIGIGNGLRNRLTEAISNGRQEECKKLVSSAYAFIAIIMGLLMVVVVIVAQFVNWNKIFGVSPDFEETLSVIVSLSVVFIAGNFILSICRNILYAIQKSSIVSILELVTQIVNLILILIVRGAVKGNVLVVALIYGGSMIAVNVVCTIVLYARNRTFLPSVKQVDLSVGKNLTSLGMKFFVVQICALVLFSTDSLMISYLYGASDVTPYSMVNKVFTAISSMYIAFIVPIWSAFTKVKAENNYIAMKKSITKLQLFMIPFIVVSVVITIFFKPIALIWLKKELDYSYGLIPMGLMYCLLTIWTNTYASIGNGLELMKPSIIVAVVQAVLNIPLSWIFAELVGLKSAGVLVGTVMVMAISAVIMPIYIHLWIGKRIKMPSDSNNLEINTEETQSNNDAEIGETLGKE
ncbi:MAG: oligosaccharide flippase family protein [Clostridiales bacterium]|nr:oligosaccharide flippase family protein [Clostridiales bacterium]